MTAHPAPTSGTSTSTQSAPVQDNATLRTSTPSTSAPSTSTPGAPSTDSGGGFGETLLAGDETSGTGTFTVTGAIHLSGTLSDVRCMQANVDNYVARGTADTPKGEVTVGAEIPAPHPVGDQEEGNSLKVGDTLYDRISMGGELLTGHRDGEKLTVTAKLLRFKDAFSVDHDQWHTVVMTTHWDCGGQLARWDKIRTRLSSLGLIDSAQLHQSSAHTPSSTTSPSPATTTTQSPTGSQTPSDVVRLPAPKAGDHTLRLTGAVTKTLNLSTIVCTGDVLTALGSDGSGVTIGVGGPAGPLVMVHIAGSPDVWRAGEHGSSAETQARKVDYPLTGTVTPYAGGVALAGVTLAHADTAVAAPDPSTTATVTGSLACAVGTLTP